MTIDSKSHLVAPAVSTEHPAIKEDAHRRLSQEEQRASSEEERETARTMVSRLPVEVGHPDPRRMIDSLRRKHAHKLIIATARKFSCIACEESQRRRLHPDAARVLHEPGTCLQVDQFEGKHPVLNLHVLGTIMVDAGSRAASVTIPRVMDTEHALGIVTSDIMLNTLLNHWIKYYGIQTVPEPIQKGTFRDQGFRRGLAAKSICLDIDPGDASWKTGVFGKTLDTILSTLSAGQERELVEAKDKELNTFVKYSVVEAASRQGISLSALTKMRWVVTFKDGGQLKARLVVQSFLKTWQDPNVLSNRIPSISSDFPGTCCVTCFSKLIKET